MTSSALAAARVRLAWRRPCSRPCWWVIGVLRSEDLQQGAEWRYDVSRINELRRLDAFYRIFQPVIQLLARLNRRIFRDSLAGDPARDPGGRAAAVLAGRGIPGPGGTDRPVRLAAVRLLLRREVRRRRAAAGGVGGRC